jgi:hypothetical protein
MVEVMTDEFEMIWDNSDNIPVRIDDIPAEFRSEHLSDASLECYHYSNKLERTT